jgi:hypothetical protein
MVARPDTLIAPCRGFDLFLLLLLEEAATSLRILSGVAFAEFR